MIGENKKKKEYKERRRERKMENKQTIGLERAVSFRMFRVRPQVFKE